ncbi:hypothetical protein M3J09_001102 [Ascochyta lentis]
MAEVLGLAASIIQLGGSGAKLSKELYVFISTAARADQDISAIARDVGTTSGVLANVGKVLETDDAIKIINQDAVEHAEDLIKQCKEVFEEILAVLEKRQKVSEDGKRRLSLMGKMYWPMKEQRVELLRRRLETLKSSLLVLFYVLQLAQNKGRGDVEKASLEEQRKHIREVHKQQQDSLRILKALEKRVCNIQLDDGMVPQGFDPSARMSVIEMRPIQPMAMVVTGSKDNYQVEVNNTAMSTFAANASDTSESDLVSTDEEGEQLTAEELAKCASNVQKLLQQITRLQSNVDNGNRRGILRKRRIHKLYRRFCHRFETDVVDRSAENLSQPARFDLNCRIAQNHAVSPQLSPTIPSGTITAAPLQTASLGFPPFKQPMNPILENWLKTNVYGFSQHPNVRQDDANNDLGISATSGGHPQTSPVDFLTGPAHQNSTTNTSSDNMVTSTMGAFRMCDFAEESHNTTTITGFPQSARLFSPVTTQPLSPTPLEAAWADVGMCDRHHSNDFSNTSAVVFNPAQSTEICTLSDSTKQNQSIFPRSLSSLGSFEEVVFLTNRAMPENELHRVHSHSEHKLTSAYGYIDFTSPQCSISPHLTLASPVVREQPASSSTSWNQRATSSPHEDYQIKPATSPVDTSANPVKTIVKKTPAHTKKENSTDTDNRTSRRGDVLRLDRRRGGLQEMRRIHNVAMPTTPSLDSEPCLFASTSFFPYSDPSRQNNCSKHSNDGVLHHVVGFNGFEDPSEGMRLPHSGGTDEWTDIDRVFLGKEEMLLAVHDHGTSWEEGGRDIVDVLIEKWTVSTNA